LGGFTFLPAVLLACFFLVFFLAAIGAVYHRSALPSAGARLRPRFERVRERGRNDDYISGLVEEGFRKEDRRKVKSPTRQTRAWGAQHKPHRRKNPEHSHEWLCHQVEEGSQNPQVQRANLGHPQSMSPAPGRSHDQGVASPATTKGKKWPEDPPLQIKDAARQT